MLFRLAGQTLPGKPTSSAVYRADSRGLQKIPTAGSFNFSPTGNILTNF
jgi:hypothetical protein